ncbi:MAG TPA: hypothetical protein VFW19_03150 [Allosphingosinicella sp.]|nr:hypothetical protein [Allosphingosinicella sp.]
MKPIAGPGRRGGRMRIPFRDVALDAMIEERDHLKIRISLIEDPDLDTGRSATATRAALAALEQRIRLHRRASGPV